MHHGKVHVVDAVLIHRHAPQHLFLPQSFVSVTNVIKSHVLNVAVSRGYDTCFMVKACDGLYQLIKSIGLD